MAREHCERILFSLLYSHCKISRSKFLSHFLGFYSGASFTISFIVSPLGCRYSADNCGSCSDLTGRPIAYADAAGRPAYLASYLREGANKSPPKRFARRPKSRQHFQTLAVLLRVLQIA